MSVNGPFDLFRRPQSARKHIARAHHCCHYSLCMLSVPLQLWLVGMERKGVSWNGKDKRHLSECGEPSSSPSWWWWWWNELRIQKIEIRFLSCFLPNVLPSVRQPSSSSSNRRDDTYPNSTACVCCDCCVCACEQPAALLYDIEYSEAHKSHKNSPAHRQWARKPVSE